MEQWLEKTPLLGDGELREIGNNICEKRIARSWTQEDLAGRIGSDHRVVSRHENGHGMNLEMLLRYASVFDCPVTALLPERFRQKLSSAMMETFTAVALLPKEKQDRIAAMIWIAIGLAA